MKGRKDFWTGLILLSFISILGLSWKIQQDSKVTLAATLTAGNITTVSPVKPTAAAPTTAQAAIDSKTVPTTTTVNTTTAATTDTTKTDTINTTTAASSTAAAVDKIVPIAKTANTAADTTAANTTTTPASEATTDLRTAVGEAATEAATGINKTIDTTTSMNPGATTDNSANSSASATNTAATTAPAAINSSSSDSGSLAINFTNKITGPITGNQTLCISLNQAVDSVIFKIIGAQNKTLSTSKPRPNTYCSDLVVDDLPNGNYKLTVEIKGASGLTTKTVDIEIKKTDVSDKAAQLQQLVQTATAIVKDKCSQAGAQSLDQCKNSLIDTYIKDVKCQNLSQEECTAYLKNTYSETVVIAENKYERIKAKASEIIGKEMQAGNLENIINEGATANISVPLKDKEIKVKAINAVENIILDKAQGLIQTAPMAITIDSDGDGIPDDIEKRIGTDPLKADSDSDGYNDSEEILKGYDPLGPGKKEIKLSPIEKAIINNQTLEHPKTSGTERESFTVDKVENVSDTNANDQNGNETTDQTKNSNGYMISGKAEPSSVATIYIYSDIPIVTTVTTDEYGNWEYHFDQSLTDGEHEVYIAINDNTGKVISKSKPFGFGIAQAQAISPQDLVIAKQDGRKAVSDNMLNFYLIFALGSILFGILIFLFAILKQKNKLKP